jgi:AcrR family transcriptional regulator
VRADARRNRDRLLDAAIELTLEIGAEPPLDAIARRADLGIGTLYRHFPDRENLLNAVAQHTLARSIEAAETALSSAPDGYDALRYYMHAAVGLGVGVLNLIRPLLDHPDWTEQRTRMTTLLEAILERGKNDGRLRRETRTPDIVFPVIRFSRAVAVGLPRADERAMAHRHLDIYIDGLGTGDPTKHPLPQPPVLGRWTG